MTIAITEMLAPKGTACRSGERRNSFLGVTIHETANTTKGAGALNHAKYLQGSGSTKAASWHYCVDDGTITRSIPESEVAWHSGTAKGNYNTIAIEICVNPDSDFKKAVIKAAELAADILKRNNITGENYKKYLYQHNQWSGKDCPHNLRKGTPCSWAYFVEQVGTHFYTAQTPSQGFSVGDSVVLNGYLYVDSYASIKGKYMTNKKAKITKIAPDANLRKAPYLLDNGLGWVRKNDIEKA